MNVKWDFKLGIIQKPIICISFQTVTWPDPVTDPLKSISERNFVFFLNRWWIITFVRNGSTFRSNVYAKRILMYLSVTVSDWIKYHVYCARINRHPKMVDYMNWNDIGHSVNSVLRGFGMNKGNGHYDDSNWLPFFYDSGFGTHSNSASESRTNSSKQKKNLSNLIRQ